MTSAELNAVLCAVGLQFKANSSWLPDTEHHAHSDCIRLLSPAYVAVSQQCTSYVINGAVSVSVIWKVETSYAARQAISVTPTRVLGSWSERSVLPVSTLCLCKLRASVETWIFQLSIAVTLVFTCLFYVVSIGVLIRPYNEVTF